MAVKLNLLPTDRKVSGSLAKTVKAVKMLNVIFLSGFLIFALGLGAFFIFNNIRLRNINADVESLKSEAANLQKSEQQMVLLKDRLSKIKTVRKTPTAWTNLTNIQTLISSVGPNTFVSELNADSNKIDMSVLFRTNSDLAAFIKNLTETKVFKGITLTTFGFNPANGYLAVFHIL